MGCQCKATSICRLEKGHKKKKLDDNVSCHQALGVYMHFYKQI